MVGWWADINSILDLKLKHLDTIPGATCCVNFRQMIYTLFVFQIAHYMRLIFSPAKCV